MHRLAIYTVIYIYIYIYIYICTHTLTLIYTRYTQVTTIHLPWHTDTHCYNSPLLYTCYVHTHRHARTRTHILHTWLSSLVLCAHTQSIHLLWYAHTDIHLLYTHPHTLLCTCYTHAWLLYTAALCTKYPGWMPLKWARDRYLMSTAQCQKHQAYCSQSSLVVWATWFDGGRGWGPEMIIRGESWFDSVHRLEWSRSSRFRTMQNGPVECL